MSKFAIPLTCANGVKSKVGEALMVEVEVCQTRNAKRAFEACYDFIVRLL
jgi:hypothetical protein